MNYINLQKLLHEQLDRQLARINQLNPPDGIVDMTLTFTSVNTEDATCIVKVNIEVCETVSGEWEVEELIVQHNKYPIEEV